MNKNTFTRFISKCDEKHFKGITLEKDGKLITLNKLSKDKNRIYFNALDEADTISIYMKNIAECEMLMISREGYQWSIYISTENADYYKVHFNMEDGYSPYAYTDDVIRNYKAVSEAIPKHLCNLKDKTIVVQHCTGAGKYKTFSEEEDGEVLPVTDNYIMPDFDYKVFYDPVAPNIPCIRMYSNSNKNIFSCAMGVSLITDRVIFTADGEFVLNIME